MTPSYPQFKCSFASYLTIIVLTTFAYSANAGDCPTKDELIAGLRAARGRIAQGVYRVSGESIDTSIGYGRVSGPMTAFAAFDYPRKLNRWDREEPAEFIIEGVNTPLRIRLKYIRTPEKTIAFDETAGVDTTHIVQIHPVEWESPKIGSPFDVRSFGLSGWSCIERGATFEVAMSNLENRAFTEIKRDGNLCRFTVEILAGVVCHMWIDCEHGFTIIKEELQVFDARTNEWGAPLDKSELKWEEHDSVWVPTAMHLERYYNGKEVYSINLEWLSVNETPDPKLFEPTGLGLDPEFVLADTRDGKAAVISYLSGERLESSYTPAALWRALYLWIGIGAAGVVVLAALAALVWRWSRSRHT